MGSEQPDEGMFGLVKTTNREGDTEAFRRTFTSSKGHAVCSLGQRLCGEAVHSDARHAHQSLEVAVLIRLLASFHFPWRS